MDLETADVDRSIASADEIIAITLALQHVARIDEAISADESCGMQVRKSRSRKSKMLCLAGLTPVAKVDQATGESAGKVVRRR